MEDVKVTTADRVVAPRPATATALPAAADPLTRVARVDPLAVGTARTTRSVPSGSENLSRLGSVARPARTPATVVPGGPVSSLTGG